MVEGSEKIGRIRAVKIIKTTLKVALGLVLALILLASLLFFAIRTPWAQQLIVSKATKYVSGKTGTVLHVEKLYLTFSGNLLLEGVYAEDLKKDTLLYSRSLEVGFDVLPLFNRTLHIDKIESSGLRANIKRHTDSTFNFNFFITAFASKNPKLPADTTPGKPFRFEMGDVHITDLKASYQDAISKFDAKISVGNLLIVTRTFDLDKLTFDLKKVSLKQSNIVFNDHNPPALASDTGTFSGKQQPFLNVDSLLIDHVYVKYTAKKDSINTIMSISTLALLKTNIDLAKQKVNSEKILLSNSDLFLSLSQAKEEKVKKEIKKTIVTFDWPDWQVDAKEISLSNNRIAYHRGYTNARHAQFDPNNIELDPLTVLLRKVYLKDSTAGFVLDQVAFKDRSGLNIKKVGFQIDIDEKAIAVKNLAVETSNSHLLANASITYHNINQLLNNPGKAYARLTVKESSLSMKDALLFAPELEKNKELKAIGKYPVRLQTDLKGYIDQLDIKHLNVAWANGSKLSLHGKVNNITHPERIFFDLPLLDATSVKSDILHFIKESKSFNIPSYVNVKVTAKGSINDLKAKLTASVPHGQAILDASYSKVNQTPVFYGNLQAVDLNVGKMFFMKELDTVSMKMDFGGSGDKLDNLSLHFSTIFDKLKIKGYNYTGACLEGNLTDKAAHVSIDHRDKNLNISALLHANLDTNAVYAADIRLVGSDLYALGLTKQNIRARVNLSADFKGDAKNFEAHLNITDGLIIKDATSYPIGSLIASAKATPVLTQADVKSDLIKASVFANTNPQNAFAKIEEHIYSYIKLKQHEAVPTAGDTINVEARILVANDALLSKVLLPGIKELDTVGLKISFAQTKKLLDINLNAPRIIYEETSLSDLKLSINTRKENLDFSLHFDSLSSGPVSMYATDLGGYYKRDSLIVQLDVNDINNDKLLHLLTESFFKQDSALIHINAGNLVLNKKQWTMPAGNKIVVADKYLAFKDFKLKHDEQFLSLTSYRSEKDHINARFENFRLGSFTSLVNAKKLLVEGLVKGDVDITEIFEKPAFNGSLQVDSFEVYRQPLGTLVASIKNVNKTAYHAELDMSGGQVEMHVNGIYDMAPKVPVLTADGDLQKIDLAFIQAFADSMISNSQGFVSGKFKLHGEVAALKYDGSILFNEAAFKINSINSFFRVTNTNTTINNDGLSIDGLTLRDENGNLSVLKGTVGTKDFMNPTFNLHLLSDNFQLVNSTRADNKLFFGKVLMDLDMQIKGDRNAPVVKVRTRLNKGTAMTVIIPADSQLKAVESEGVVVFTNMKDPDDPMTNERHVTTRSSIKGMQLHAIIQIDPATKFTVVMDESSGDFLEVEGEANLSFNMEQNGRMTMSGSYELNGGQYKASLYGVVKREFKIVPGSSIAWSGTDPLNATLNITAAYDVKTSAYDLMASQLGGSDVTVKNRYKQVLPFIVLINIEGKLLQPLIHFNIDMSKKDRGALGGNVYARLQQLEQNENELNTQVFALLVMNRFLPNIGGNSGSDEGGGSSALAKSSVSQILSGQLNSLSQKYVKFVDINVDLNSYTDYETGIGNEKTDLNLQVQKKLFNDRIVVKVGSQVNLEADQPATAPQTNSGANNTGILGDASVEYLLTPDGKYLLTGFRKNEYGSVIDGQLIITGISVVLNKEFDHFYEIWRNPEKR